MRREEFIRRYGQDLAELKLTGVLDYGRYQKMTPDERADFMARDVLELAKKFIHQDWSENVTVRFEYSVVDSYLNKQLTVVGYCNFSHTLGVTHLTFDEQKE